MILGLIADGNRRWAKLHGFSSSDGHEAGFRVVSDVVIPTCKNHPEWTGLVIYAFSTENWKRDIFEISALFSLFERMCAEWMEKCQKENIRVYWAGRRDRVPASLKNSIESLESLTRNNTSFTIYLCIDYGAHDEIIRAVHLAGIDFEKHLELPMLDYIIRTGGEQRLSGFCLWQSEYAELVFISEFLPELTKSRLEELLESFTKRERRKGK